VLADAVFEDKVPVVVPMLSVERLARMEGKAAKGKKRKGAARKPQQNVSTPGAGLVTYRDFAFPT
jgi:hypothetical protein